tara:strand:- start:103 stop:453 length:351 start_codon:yes stop_codon:yes gene_type:complete
MVDKIQINHRPYSRNAVDKWHWAKKQRLKKEYQFLIRSEMNRNKIKGTCEKCSIKITCGVKRLMDIDNLIAGLKQFIDALCIERYIHDDSPKWLELQVKQEKSKQYKIIVEREVCI